MMDMDIEFHYVSNRTLDEDVKTNIINPTYFT